MYIGHHEKKLERSSRLVDFYLFDLIRIKVRAGEITIGKPLAWDVYDDKGVLLLQTGYIIATSTQLDILMSPLAKAGYVEHRICAAAEWL